MFALDLLKDILNFEKNKTKQNKTNKKQTNKLPNKHAE